MNGQAGLGSVLPAYTVHSRYEVVIIVGLNGLEAGSICTGGARFLNLVIRSSCRVTWSLT